jgi:Mg-chelatase subunit ChlD
MPSKRFVLSSAAMAGLLLVSMGLAQLPASAKDPEHKPRIDLAFCIDTTGSMQHEIDAVKTKTKEIVAKLAGSKPIPDIRVGLVAYRDRGDEYVTRVFQFSDNIDQVVKDISSLKAGGGGDEPESVNEALHVAVNDLKWSDEKKTVKLLFLIGDAGPHSYSKDFSWETESKHAIARGIQINTIACDGLRSEGLNVFQQIAKLADGKCEFLTYRQEVVNADGHRSTIISSAGRLYKVKAPSAEAWRAGADKLMATGAADAIAPSAGAGGSFAGAPAEMEMMGDRPVVTDFRAAAAPMSMSKASPARMRHASFGKYASASPPVSRADSNLADIVLSATKDAAKKKANIEFKD